MRPPSVVTPPARRPIWARVAPLTVWIAGAALAAAPGPAPTIDDAAAATYRGLADLPAAVTLRDGTWEGEPYAPGGASRPRAKLERGMRLTGDVDGDGAAEAVVFLSASGGGSGAFLHLAVLGRRDGQVVVLATLPIGDRVQLRTARIENNAIVLGVLQTGPSDAMCCPGELATRTVVMADDGRLVERAPSNVARLSPAILEGREWVLRRFAPGDPAPTQPEVTLVVDGDRWAGSSGCNRYMATAKPAEQPGGVAIGPVAGTRKACPEAVMAVEDRYLRTLARVVRFGFRTGRLVLTAPGDDRSDSLEFDSRPLVK